MKKKVTIFFAFLLLSNLANAQSQLEFKNDSVKKFIDKTRSLIHDNALNKDKIDWTTLRNDIYKQTSNATDIDSILFIYPYLFEKIEDHHGWLSYKGKDYRWTKKSKPLKNENLKNAVKKHKSVYGTLLHKNIGYLRIPGNRDFSAKKMDSIAGNIVDEIDRINSKKIKAWIIDLRLNTGGNMYPMMSGISDLIGNNEKIGGFITSGKQSDGEWILKDGNLYVDSNQVLNRRKLIKSIKKTLPIAVLISSYTASSGEMTAISLIGKNNTKTFGEQSAGYTTTNQGFKINQHAGLNLAVGYVTDRTGKVYPENVKPDHEIIGGDDFDDLLNDQKIVNALRWFKHAK